MSDYDFPDPDAVSSVLALATRAPSVHNSQPWRWRVGPRSVQLFADPSRPGAADRREVLISCGAALHHCAVALAAKGWRATIRRMPDPRDHDHLADITVARQSPGELDVMLAAAIPHRHTDRRAYSSWPVPWGDIALMGARAARAGVMLRQIDLLPQLNAIVADSAFRYTDDVLLAGPARARSADDNAVVIALGTEGDDDVARLRAGEATSLVLLSATAMGLATCPVSEPLEIEETRAAVRADVFGGTGYPQMMMRVGWAAVDAEPLPPTPRRPLTETVEWADDRASVAGVDPMTCAG